MKFKACTCERLALSFFFGGGVEALKSGKLHFWKWIYTAQASTLGVSFFILVRFRPWDPTKTVKRVPKLRFEPVSFLFLVCFESIIENSI